MLDNHPRAVRRARRAVTGALRSYGIDGEDDELVEVVELLTSELVTNAIRHGSPPIGLTAMVVPAGGVRVEVCDATPADVEPREPGPLAVGGRGLQMVETLAERWGTTHHDAGKTVWFEVRMPAPAVADATTSATL